jgi:hypothetical protein
MKNAGVFTDDSAGCALGSALITSYRRCRHTGEHMRLGGWRPRLLARWGTASAVVATALAGFPGPALALAGGSSTQAVLYQENFAGGDTAIGDWISKSTGGSYRPCLTAAAAPTTGGIPECKEVAAEAGRPDAAGSGAFQITNNSGNQSGFGLFTRPLRTDKGLRVDFDMYQFNAHPYKDSLGSRGGDGLTFFLLNGSASPASAGDAGGSLGYRNLPGAVIGLGFDEFGNFSNPQWGGTGGPGTTPNSVVLRGADSTGYRYIAGVKAPAMLAVDGTVKRESAKRHVTIELSTKNVLSVFVNFFNGKGAVRVIGPINLNKVKDQPPLPPTIKFGFAAATGSATAYHDIAGMTVVGLPPDLSIAVSHSGPFKAGQTGNFQLAVANDAGAGPTTGPATVVFHGPDGLTPQSPSGDGWQCSVDGQAVTCTRADTLNNGSAYPPINLPVTVAGSASGTLTATGSVSDPGDTGPSGKTATDSVRIGALSPDISVTSTHTGGFAPGGTGTYVLNVSNRPQAGPTTGPVTVTFPVPGGMTPTTATGTGWTCTISGQNVSCTRSDVLAPGAGYPPLSVGVSVGQGTVGVVTSTVSAATPTDANPQSVTASDTVTINPPPPDLSMGLSTTGPLNAGSTGTFNLTVSNQAGAGPTTGPVTTTFQVPDGMTVQSATGGGWACSLSGQKVTCTRSGSGADALNGGTSYPPTVITVAIPATAAGQVPASATVGTPGDTGRRPETAQTTVSVTPLAPDVGVAVTAPGVLAGGPATITMVASDNAAAGPVFGQTTVTFPAPAGYAVTSANGRGWQCSTQGQTVSCTRDDDLAPGDSFPPVTVTLAVPVTASGSVPLSASVQTAGQGAGNGATATLPVRAVPPKLLVSLGDQGTFNAGQAGGSYLITVSDAVAAGPVTGPVTVTLPLPSGITALSATGTGWTCTVGGSRVTCTRTDPLAPGASYPVITVATTVGGTLSGSVTASVSASTQGPAGPITACGKHTLVIGQLGSLVTVAVTPPASLTAGDTGTYTLVASNAPPGGPTTGPTTVGFTVPDGVDVTAATGLGWQCTVTGQNVSCTRNDALQPGSSFPPIQVSVSLPCTATGTVTTTGSVSTPGNGASSGVQVNTQTSVTPLAPDLTVDVGGQGSATDGSGDTTGVTVSDGSSAGPVTDPVTVTIPAPAGTTPRSAHGNGWNCGGMNSGYGFVCVTVGGLAPGQRYPTIDTAWNVNGHVTGTVPVHATCYTANQADLSGAQGWSSVNENAPGADVSAQVVTSGAVQAGGTEDMTVDVADAANAGPATGNVSVTVPMPSQIHPTSVYGYGWNCSEFWQDVTCQRPNGGTGLQPGSAYPPITVSGTAVSSWSGTRVWATASSS